MPTLFSDLNKSRNTLLHRWSVWQEVLAHLSKFVDTDAEPAKLGITTRGEGMTVPQDVIVEVLEQVQTTIDNTMLELNDVEQTLMEDRNVRKESAAGKEGKKGGKVKGQTTRGKAVGKDPQGNQS